MCFLISLILFLKAGPRPSEPVRTIEISKYLTDPIIPSNYHNGLKISSDSNASPSSLCVLLTFGLWLCAWWTWEWNKLWVTCDKRQLGKDNCNVNVCLKWNLPAAVQTTCGHVRRSVVPALDWCKTDCCDAHLSVIISKYLAKLQH